jgi:hypothetical protein
VSFLEGYKGAGDVQLQLIVNGVPTGALIDAGNINSLMAAMQPERQEIISRRRLTAGNALDSVNARTPLKVTWKGNTFFRQTWDFLLLGTTTDYAGAAVVNEPCTVRVLDEWQQLGDQETFPAHTLDEITDDEAGTTTYVLNTDYEYRAEDGAVKFLSTGSISLDDVVYCDVTAPSTGYEVAMNTVTEKTVRMTVNGINEFNGKDTFLQLYQVSNMPNSEPDLLAGEIQEFEFEGTCEVPSWASEPGKWHYID